MHLIINYNYKCTYNICGNFRALNFTDYMALNSNYSNCIKCKVLSYGIYIFLKYQKIYGIIKGYTYKHCISRGFFLACHKIWKNKWANLFALVFFFFFLFLLSETQVYVFKSKQCRSEQSYVFLHCESDRKNAKIGSLQNQNNKTYGNFSR